jgi:two-component system sensor histidine kinase DesK
MEKQPTAHTQTAPTQTAHTQTASTQTASTPTGVAYASAPTADDPASAPIADVHASVPTADAPASAQILKLPPNRGWLYLANLAFFFLPWLAMRFSYLEYALMGLGVLAFIGCYFQAYQRPAAQMTMPVLAMLAIAIMLTPLNPGVVSLFSYVSFFIGFALPRTQALLGIGSLVLLQLLLDWGLALMWRDFLFFAIPAIVMVGGLGMLEQRTQRLQWQQQQSTDEIKQLAAMVERERIARDLHDILGHSLSSIALKADLAGKLLAKQQYSQAAQQLDELSHIARDSLSQVRHSVSGYKHKGLTATVTDLLARLRDAGFQAELMGQIPQLDPRRETALVLILTELVTNVIRHSRGQHCQLRFVQQQQQLFVEVEDDGTAPAAWQAGNGMTGIQERLAALGGDCHTDVERGFCQRIRLPLVS